ncbi:NAD(P)/FAD-dependent oxidoreductase [Brevibacillus daliensis]|uniref:NAD(P)/FAD-dependent oxidoreductase n=1 Tax=Brevibacillus daliensis TaxID=2892995 RepID=UPI001E39C590|nr:NAD(P)/FAD-dependent oxidoreductase [Brevibacillus daliensis]
MIYDTIVIGGGIAGLQATIQLVRSRRKVLVIDSGMGRSVLARNYQNILGFPDGVSGEELRQRGQQMAKKWGAVFLEATATFCEQNEDGIFQVTVQNEDQLLLGRTLLFSTGIKDVLPPIPGLLPCLGKSIYICPDCDGFEIINKSTVVIGSGIQAINMADSLQYYSDDLTVINHARINLDHEEQKITEKWGSRYRNEEIAEILQVYGMISGFRLQSGETYQVERGFLAFKGAHVNTDLMRTFQIGFLDKGHVRVDPRTKETTHRNIWAAGDINAHSQQVVTSLADGAVAAIWIHKRLFEIT